MTKSNELPTNPIPLKTFTLDRAKGTLTAMASDFGALRDGLWWLGRLYKDAADLGITIKSELTGHEERFYLAREERTGDGELVAWHFIPVELLANITLVTIYND